METTPLLSSPPLGRLDRSPSLKSFPEFSPSSESKSKYKHDKMNALIPAGTSASTRKFYVGISLLLCVVALWTLSNFITSGLLVGGYNKPFLITYLNTSAFSFYLIPFYLQRWNKRRRGRLHSDSQRTTSQSSGSGVGYKPVSQRSSLEAIRSRLPLLNARTETRALTTRRSNSLIRSSSPSPALVTIHSLSTTSSSATHHGHPVIFTAPVPIGSTLAPLPPQEISIVSSGSALGLGLGDSPFENEINDVEDKLSTEDTAKLAAVFCFVWFAANWSVNASLGLTSVGSSTVLAGMSGFFTLGLGRMFGVETLTRAKVLAVLASFFGLILVTHSDAQISSESKSIIALSLDDSTIFSTVATAASAVISSVPRNPIAGDMLALLSAFCYAIYVILLKVKIGDEERIDMQLFFGFVGLCNTIFLLPIIPLLHYLEIESFSLPTTTDAWIICGVNMAITLSSDYLYVLSMLKTTPLVVTIGLSLTIPFALLGDFLKSTLYSSPSSPGSPTNLSLQAVLGATLVICGFGLMGLEGLGAVEAEAEVDAELELDAEGGAGVGFYEEEQDQEPQQSQQQQQQQQHQQGDIQEDRRRFERQIA